MRWAAIAIATALAALMYVAVYGGSVIVSVERLTTSQYDVDGTATSPSAALDDLNATITVVVLAVVCMTLLVLRPPWTRGDRRWNVAAASWGLMLVALGIGTTFLAPILGDHIHNPFGAEEPIATTIVDGLRAGIGEEVLVLAIPVTLMRISKCPWTVGLVILFALRMLYHLYYGIPGALWLAPWALVVAACFWRWTTWPVLLGFVALHALFDMRGLLPVWHEYYTLSAGIALLIVVAAVAVFRSRPTTRRHAWRSSLAPQISRPLARAALRVERMVGNRVIAPLPVHQESGPDPSSTEHITEDSSHSSTRP